MGIRSCSVAIVIVIVIVIVMAPVLCDEVIAVMRAMMLLLLLLDLWVVSAMAMTMSTSRRSARQLVVRERKETFEYAGFRLGCLKFP